MEQLIRSNHSTPLLGKPGMVELHYFYDQANRNTFLIPTVRYILEKYNVGKGWIDPFANTNSPAEITNDIDESMPTTYHLNALEFLGLFSNESKVGILLDPPYSMNQAVHTYNNKKLIDITPVYDLAASILKKDGLAICFGWNSIGLGRNRGFMTEEIYLICHGGRHNDTIVTVQRKLNLAEHLTLF